ncbi:MAG: FUSC family protein [Gemmatimonadaceae bacterium]
MPNMSWSLAASILNVDWSRFEGVAALRCSIGVAIPLIAGVAIDQSAVGVFGAAGAVGAGFGSFQGTYRSRAAVMLLASLGMAFSVFVGSVATHSIGFAIAAAALWGFGGGLLVALGQAASFVGLQSIVTLLIAGGFPSDFQEAAGRAGLVFAGGLIQTVLVVMIWPLRRFAVERRSLAAVYRSLASYARGIPTASAAAPEPHILASTPSPLADPQPFAASANTLVFQALLDEAERIRASLAALAVHHRRLVDSDRSCADTLSNLLGTALAEIAAALSEGREPRAPPELSPSLADCAKRLSPGTTVEPLLGQVRAAWRTAGVLTAPPESSARRREDVARPRWRPGVRNSLITLRANLTLRSTACRHALRLATTLSLAAGVASAFEVSRGYWLPMTVALVLKPDFHDTFTFSVARVGGTVLGAAGATVIARVVAPGPVALIVLVLCFVWAGYALAATNYVAFALCITGYVVFLLALAGVPETAAATARVTNTAIAGALALAAYGTWPTWAAQEMRPALASMLEEQGRYLGELLSAYNHPEATDVTRLDEIRASARLARSNSEAVAERTLSEPRRRHSMKPSTVVGLLAATRRNALAALALHAGLEREPRATVPGIDTFARQVTNSLLTLASAVRSGTEPPPLPPLRDRHRALDPLLTEGVRDETDLMVDSVDTIAELLRKDARETGNEEIA